MVERIHRTSRFFAVLLGCVLPHFGLCQPTDPGKAQVIVFVQPGVSEVARDFEEKHLPEIRMIADEFGAEFQIINAQEGAPEEITVTPVIVFQNTLGRSIYVGRYNLHDKIRAFIRTSQNSPQQAATFPREDVLLRKEGRTLLAAPIKVVPVEGHPPRDYNHQHFVDQARKAVADGTTGFTLASGITQQRTDRAFYMDFYPWRSRWGKLNLSVALFSQFNCDIPVYKEPGETFTGSWTNRDEVFKQAAAAMAEAINREMTSPSNGDGFDPLGEGVPVVSWEQLGLSLPKAKPEQDVQATQTSVDGKWKLQKAKPDAPPRIQFRFPAPLDNYFGEVKEVQSELDFGDSGDLSDLKGWFEADSKSVTMGEAELDHSIRGAAFLHISKHPTVRFDIDSSSDIEPSTVTVNGNLQMKEIVLPLEAELVFESKPGSDGNETLALRGTFTLPLTPFNMEGPDGPADAKDKLLFDLNLSYEQVN